MDDGSAAPIIVLVPDCNGDVNLDSDVAPLSSAHRPNYGKNSLQPISPVHPHHQMGRGRGSPVSELILKPRLNGNVDAASNHLSDGASEGEDDLNQQSRQHLLSMSHNTEPRVRPNSPKHRYSLPS